MSTRKCAVTSCEYFHNPAVKGSDVYFFNIPSLTTEYGKKWECAFQGLSTKFSGPYVCSLHFNRTDIEVFETSTEGVKYVKLKRGAVPMNYASKPAKEADFNLDVQETIRFVDIKVIKEGSGTENIADKKVPLQAQILQPLPKQSSCKVQSQQTHHKQLISCGQCKMYREKLKVFEKRCRELEEFIRTNWNSNNVKNENLLKSILSIENSTPAEESRSSRDPNGNGEAMSGNDNTSNFNVDEYVSAEMLSDNDNGRDDEIMDQVDSETLEIMKPTQLNRTNVVKPALKVPKTVIMYNYYKCNSCNGSRTFNSTSELLNHRKECHGSTRSSYLYADGVAEHPVIYKNIAQTICMAQRTATTKTLIEPPRFVNTARGSYTIPSIDALFKCGVCTESVSFRTINELQKHMNEMHKRKSRERGVHKCSICDGSGSFDTVHQLRRHEKETHGNVVQYECYICKIKLDTFADVTQHSRLHVQARSEQCAVCDEMWTPKELNRHICARGKCIQCEYCTKSFGAMVKLIRHIETEHGKEQILHRCDQCRRFFGMAYLKELHVKHHKALPKFRIIGNYAKAFSSNYSEPTTRDHLCSECGKGFFGADRLAAHIQTHGERNVQCPDCPAAFTTKRLLNFHREIHNPVKIKCNACPKILRSRGALQRHISESMASAETHFTLHTKLVYDCTQTRFAHSSKGAIKKHACSFCPYKSVKKSHLNNHLRMHTGERPYECEYCPDRKYRQKGDLTKHLQTHFGRNIYRCGSCEKAFRLLEDLKKHSFEHYKEEREKLGTEQTSSAN